LPEKVNFTTVLRAMHKVRTLISENLETFKIPVLKSHNKIRNVDWRFIIR